MMLAYTEGKSLRNWFIINEQFKWGLFYQSRSRVAVEGLINSAAKKYTLILENKPSHFLRELFFQEIFTSSRVQFISEKRARRTQMLRT